MLFNDYYFIFWFLPLTLLLYHTALATRRTTAAKWVLLGSSLLFYSLWKLAFLPQFLLSILCNHLIGTRFQSRTDVSASRRTNREKALLWLGMGANLALLFYYKYLTFFASQSNLLLGTDFVLAKIVMPLGISFFTFMQMSYLFECYQGRVKSRTTLLDYAQFITFFPHLIAGPIILHKELIPQFNDHTRMRTIPLNMAVGLFLFALGLFKKVVIADSLAENATLPFDRAAYDGVRVWIGVLSYTLQLYFDFSGYMDMAMGIARMFNFDLPVNFESPLRATNISAFWRRWHITMTRFFMNYVFMPLAMRAARRHADIPPGRQRRFIEATAMPILATFILAGIWHGAGWNFIVFGLWHGCGLVIHRLWEMSGRKMPTVPAWMLTFLFVTVGFIFFRSPDLEVAGKVLSGMLTLNGDPAEWRRLPLIGVAIAIALLPRNSQTLASAFQPTWRTFGWTMSAIMASLALINRQTAFLYWQF
ncbi:MBOAT family protein [Azoarcus sp. L1K30]|uniref:MBOAT family O-acyltransferase n=1 Tax=Azoarcus sp. L1K30 TaxID=2820277 RepID=UPI001B81989C|nr:MBOAT family protein [Azoarcus sp. L1K30]MBR0566027.1 MBOAT family protein [Azoarcus sp. L1K30]